MFLTLTTTTMVDYSRDRRVRGTKRGTRVGLKAMINGAAETAIASLPRLRGMKFAICTCGAKTATVTSITAFSTVGRFVASIGMACDTPG